MAKFFVYLKNPFGAKIRCCQMPLKRQFIVCITWFRELLNGTYTVKLGY